MFDISEQRLMGQKGQIMKERKKKKKWLKNFELEEMQECESVEDQWLLQLDEEEKNVFVKDFRVVETLKMLNTSSALKIY